MGAARSGSHAVVVLPDLHLPIHDRRALRVVLNACEAIRPRRIVILGDWLDAAFASGHPVSSREEAEVSGSKGGYIGNEIEPCRRLLAELEDYCEEIIYLEGNHEFRVERLITREGGAWLAIPELVMPRVLLAKGRKKKFKWVPFQHNAARTDTNSLPHYKIADGLIAVHGWSTAKNAAARHLDIVRGYSIVYGHTHRAQSQTIRHPMTGRVLKGWSPGCLSSLQPMWMHSAPTEWVHGFSVIYCRDNLSAWTSYTITIDRGKCILPDGTKVDGGSTSGRLYCEETIGS